jgi:hypothetical protein
LSLWRPFAWAVLFLAGSTAVVHGQISARASEDADTPDVTVSLAVGSHFRTHLSSFSGPGTETCEETHVRYDPIIPVVSASVQLPLWRSIVLEAELMRSKAEGDFVNLTPIVDGVAYGSRPRRRACSTTRPSNRNCMRFWAPSSSFNQPPRYLPRSD